MTEAGRRRVVELSPGLGRLLRAALVADGRLDLADSIEGLEAHAACSCGDAFCTSFYTGPRPDGAWGPDHENLVYVLAGGIFITLAVVRNEPWFAVVTYIVFILFVGLRLLGARRMAGVMPQVIVKYERRIAELEARESQGGPSLS